jgi:hypothetical protein
MTSDITAAVAVSNFLPRLLGFTSPQKAAVPGKCVYKRT